MHSSYLYLIIIISATLSGLLLSYALIQFLFKATEKRKQQWLKFLAPAAKQIPVADLVKSFVENPALLAQVEPEIEKHVDHFLRVKLAEKMPMISMFIGEKTITQMKEVLLSELNNIIPALIQQLTGNLEKNIDLEQIILQKTTHISPFEFFATAKKIAAKPISLFIFWGAFSGLLIGIFQALLIYLVG